MQVGEKKLRQTLLAGTAAIALMVGVPEIAAAGDNSSSGVSASVEGRYYFGFGDEFVHAQNLIVPPTTAFTNAEVSSDRAWNGRAAIGYSFGNWDVAALYSGIYGRSSSDDVAFATPGVVPFPATLFFPNVIPPGTLITVTSGTATADLTYHVVDFEVGYTMQLGQGATARVSGGVRYANIENELSADYNFGVGFPLRVDRDVDYWGVGPRLGAGVHVPLDDESGWSIDGGVAGAALFGERETSIRHFAASPEGDTLSDSFDDDDSQTVYSLEGQAGLSYAFWPTMVVTVGYAAEAWFQVNDTRYSDFNPLLTGAPLPARRGTGAADQFFHGPFLRFTVKF